MSVVWLLNSCYAHASSRSIRGKQKFNVFYLHIYCSRRPFYAFDDRNKTHFSGHDASLHAQSVVKMVTKYGVIKLQVDNLELSRTLLFLDPTYCSNYFKRNKIFEYFFISLLSKTSRSPLNSRCVFVICLEKKDIVCSPIICKIIF